MKKSIPLIFREGILTNNPTFVQLLGMCPTLATTTSVRGAFGMGLAVIAVLSCSNLIISLLRRIIPKQVRIASYIVIISGFVTAAELIIKAYFPSVNKALGLFIPLIVVNCIILARAEAFASKNSVAASALDGIFQGLGYTLVLIVMCIIRELLGNGTFGGGLLGPDGAGVRILPEGTGALMLILPVGGFLTLGCLIALMQYLLRKHDEKKEAEDK